ncbi:MAG: carboxypeptidase regulatory-like domain-containing protein [Aeoliella sp.]
MLIRKIVLILLLALAVTHRPSLAENLSSLANTANALDFALTQGGTLQGRLLDSDGQPVANRVVTVGRGESANASTTDKNGNFSVSGLQGGSYEFTDADGIKASFRLWAPDTQPPSAQSGQLLLSAEAKGKGGNGNGNGNGNGKPDKPPRECRLSPSHPHYMPHAECPPTS